MINCCLSILILVAVFILFQKGRMSDGPVECCDQGFLGLNSPNKNLWPNCFIQGKA